MNFITLSVSHIPWIMWFPLYLMIKFSKKSICLPLTNEALYLAWIICPFYINFLRIYLKLQLKELYRNKEKSFK